MPLISEEKKTVKRSILLFVIINFIIFFLSLNFIYLENPQPTLEESVKKGFYISLSIGFISISLPSQGSESIAITIKILGIVGWGIIGYIIPILVKGMGGRITGSIPEKKK